MRASAYLAFPLMALLAVVQTAVFARYPLFGMVPQLPFLVALSWGLLHDVEEGVTWAFFAGLFIDLFSITPTGLTALAWMLSILLVLWLMERFPQSRFILPTLSAALATLVALLFQFLLLRLSGHALILSSMTPLLSLVILHGILVLPVYWTIYALARRLRPRRVAME